MSQGFASPHGEPRSLFRINQATHGAKTAVGRARRQSGVLTIQLARQRAPVRNSYVLTETLVKGSPDVSLDLTDHTTGTRSSYTYESEAGAFRFGRAGTRGAELRAAPDGRFRYGGQTYANSALLGRTLAASPEARALLPEALCAAFVVLETQTAANARLIWELIIRPLIAIIKEMLTRLIVQGLSAAAPQLLAAVDTMGWGDLFSLYDRLCWGEVPEVL